MQFVSWVFWDTKLELGNSNWIPVICADYYADNWVDCKLSAANEFSGIWSFSSWSTTLVESFKQHIQLSDLWKCKLGVLSPDKRHEWEELYCAYAEYYQLPMNTEILETVWSWIFTEDEALYALVARNIEHRPIDLMHFQGIPSPLRGKM